MNITSLYIENDTSSLSNNTPSIGEVWKYCCNCPNTTFVHHYNFRDVKTANENIRIYVNTLYKDRKILKNERNARLRLLQQCEQCLNTESYENYLTFWRFFTPLIITLITTWSLYYSNNSIEFNVLILTTITVAYGALYKILENFSEKKYKSCIWWRLFYIVGLHSTRTKPYNYI